MLNGMLKGVGPKTAEAIVEMYGSETIEILNSDQAVKQLQKV